MKWLNLHHLKYFFVIVEEGTLTKAAQKLLVGQPALSAQLKLFEENLGAALFLRKGKKLILTPVGEYVYKYAKAIKGLEDELLSNLDHVTNYEEKELVLGAQENVPKSVLAKTIMKIQKVRPVFVRVLEGKGDELFNLLTIGKIDIFIGNFRPLSTSKEILYKSLGKEEVYIWGSKEKTVLKKNFPQSLNGEDFVLSGLQNQLRHDFEKYMLESGMKFHVSVEAQDTALQKELVTEGLGLLLLGKKSAAAWVKSGRLFQIGKLPSITEEYWLGIVKKDLDNQFIKEMMAAF